MVGEQLLFEFYRIRDPLRMLVDVVTYTVGASVGPLDGATVVMVFLTANTSTPLGPKKKLVGFHKVFLPVDTVAAVEIPLVPNFMLTVQEDGASCAVPGTYTLHVAFETPDTVSSLQAPPTHTPIVRTVALDVTGTSPVCGLPLPSSRASSGAA